MDKESILKCSKEMLDGKNNLLNLQVYEYAKYYAEDTIIEKCRIIGKLRCNASKMCVIAWFLFMMRQTPRYALADTPPCYGR